MNKLLVCVLLICSTAYTAIAAENPAPQQPVNLIKALDVLYERVPDRQMKKKEARINPETGMLEYSVEIKDFKCDSKSTYLSDAIKAFDEDQNCGYQFSYMDPSNRDLCLVSTGDGMVTLHKPGAETWMLCVKNETNPALRDVYALTIEHASGVVNGTVYRITSARPDIRQTAKVRSGIFVLDGVVDDSADSLKYVYVYVGKDSPAYSVPIEDKKFRFSIPLNEIKKAQIHAVFSDGELSKEEVDIYLIPGFTMNLVVRGGRFVIGNGQEYYAEVNKYGGLLSSDTEKNRPGKLEINLKKAIEVYTVMINKINQEISNLTKEIHNYPGKQETFTTLSNQRKDIYMKMQALIDAYAAEVQGEE